MIDDRIREDIFPTRIVASEGNIEGVEKFCDPIDLQIGVAETRLIHITGKAFVVFDFGKEINGGIRVLMHHAKGGFVKARVRCGESVSECYAEKDDRGAHNHHTLRDAEFEFIDLSDMSFLETGFRFIRIDFPEGTDAYVKAVTAVYVHRKLERVGSFTCNDKRVNEIFETAAHTLTLNMQRYIWDGIKRDRLVWVGDMHPETLGIISLFGEDKSVVESLEYARSHTPLPEWINGIPAYSMWYLIILADYYMQTGNAEYIASQRTYIDGLVRQIDERIADDGTVDFGDCLFDWPSHGKPDEIIGITAVTYLAARSSLVLFQLLGLDITICEKMMEKLKNFKRNAVEFKQCEAMKTFAGLSEAADTVDFLTAGGSKGLCTFMSYYILTSVAEAGKADVALEMMKNYYGAMLDKGATTFWETFDTDWIEGSSRIDELPKAGEKDIHGDFGDFCYVGFRHSLCHGWSCGPVPFLIRTVTGIEPLTPGCKIVSVDPVSAGLMTYTAEYPTPYGTIKVELQNGKFTVTRPKKVKVVVPDHRKKEIKILKK